MTGFKKNYYCLANKRKRQHRLFCEKEKWEMRCDGIYFLLLVFRTDNNGEGSGCETGEENEGASGMLFII